jgi:hypothetical protein
MAQLDTQVKTVLLLDGKQPNEVLKELDKKANLLADDLEKAIASGDKKEVEKLYKEYTKVQKETEQIKKNTFDVEKVLKNMNGSSLKDLNRAYKELKNTVASTNDKQSAGYKQNISDLKKLETEIDRVRKEMKATSGKEAKGGGIFGQILGVAGGIGLAGALNGIKDFFAKAINSSEAFADKYEAVMGGAKEATNAFFRSILEGDWSNLIDNMNIAYEAGKKYIENLDELEDRHSGLSITTARYSLELAKLEIAYKAAHGQEKINLLEKYLNKKKELAAIDEDIAYEELKNVLDMIKSTSDNTEMVDYYAASLEKLNKLKLQEIEYTKGVLQVRKLYQDALKDKTIPIELLSVYRVQKEAAENGLYNIQQQIKGVKDLQKQVEESTDPELKKQLIEKETAYYTAQSKVYDENTKAFVALEKAKIEIAEESAEAKKKADAEEQKQLKEKNELRQEELKLLAEIAALKGQTTEDKYQSQRSVAVSTYEKAIIDADTQGTTNADLKKQKAALELSNALTAIDKEEKDEKLKNENDYAAAKAKVESDLLNIALSAQEIETNAVIIKYETLIAAAKEYGINTVQAEEQMKSEIDIINKKYAKQKQEDDKKAREEQIKNFQTGLSITADYVDAISSMQKVRQQKETNALEKERQAKITAAKGDKNKIAKIEAEYDKKADELKREQLEKQKKWQIAQVRIEEAGALAKIWSTYGWNPVTLPIALLQAGAIILKSEAQVGAIKAQQYAAGNVDVIGAQDGRKYNATYGGTPNGVTYANTPKLYLAGEAGPEMIIDAKRTRNMQLNYPDLIQAIRNVPQYASGNVSSTTNINNASNSALVNAINKLNQHIDNGIDAKVVLSQFERVQNKRNAVIDKMKE